jgi:hypothetical protein
LRYPSVETRRNIPNVVECRNKKEHTKCCGIMQGNEATMFLPASFLDNGVEFRVL